MPTNAWAFFDRIHCIRLQAGDAAWNILHSRLEYLGVAGRTSTSQLDAGVVDWQARVTLAHRRVIETAVAEGVERLLVLEDACLLLADASALLTPIVAELNGRDWSTLHLGATIWGHEPELCGDCRHLASNAEFSGTYAVAYNRPAMLRLMAEIPGDVPHLGDWVHLHKTYDSYLTTLANRVLCHPRIATVAGQLIYEDPARRNLFLANA